MEEILYFIDEEENNVHDFKRLTHRIIHLNKNKSNRKEEEV